MQGGGFARINVGCSMSCAYLSSLTLISKNDMIQRADTKIFI